MSDTVVFSKRIPRDLGNRNKTVPIAYIDIPKPDAASSVSIIDTRIGTVEDDNDKGIVIPFQNQTSAIPVSKSVDGPLTNPNLGQRNTFIVNGSDTLLNTKYTSQIASVSPISIDSIEEDGVGSWYPIINRGIFYRVITMSDGPTSWLNQHGYLPGETLVVAYTTELDWRYQNSTTLPVTGISGGGGLQNIRSEVPLASDPSTINLFSYGVSSSKESFKILSVGGLITSQGNELLTEAGSYTSVPGDGSGKLNYILCEVYQASSTTNVESGLIRSASPIGSFNLASSSLVGSQLTLNSILISAGVSTSLDPTTLVIKFSGSFFVANEQVVTFNTTYTGKLRFYHWNIPVIDRWYGPSNLSGVTSTSINYKTYMHTGWHDFSIEWSPEKTLSLTSPQIEILNTNSPANFTYSSKPTTRSEVSSINVNTGEVRLKHAYLDPTSNNSTQFLASFTSTSSGLPFRGYFDAPGVWHSLDLNPSYGRMYDTGLSSTNAWINSTCVIWMLPSMACKIADVSGNPVLPTWYSAVGRTKSTIRWSAINGNNSVNSGYSLTIPLGSTSAFGSEIIGQSPYSSIGAVSGLMGGVLQDPRGDYKSGFIIGELNVSNGAPVLDSVKYYDIRVRGGGLSYEDNPNTVLGGAAKARLNTYWDLSPWNSDVNLAGTTIVSIPSSILDGSDGGPIFSKQEIQEIVESTVSCGIKAVIEYV